MATRTITIEEPTDESSEGIALTLTRGGGATQVVLTYTRHGITHHRAWAGAELPGTVRTALRNAVLGLLAVAKPEWGF